MHRFVRVILCRAHANLMPAHVSWVSMASIGFFKLIYGTFSATGVTGAALHCLH